MHLVLERQNRSGRHDHFHRPPTGATLDPAALDRLADRELQHGHARAAEWLASRADALRDVVTQ